MKCSDPYCYGCKENAEYHRDRRYSDRPDYPEYLCEECYDAMAFSGGIDENEWMEVTP